LGLVPVMPPFGLDMLVHIAIDGHCLGMVPPRSSQKKGVRRCTPAQATVDKDQSVASIFLRGCCGEVALVFGKDLAVLKNGSCPTKDKVHCPFNITVFVELACTIALHIERVLIPEKPTVLEDCPVCR